MEGELYDRLEQYMPEADNSRPEAFEEPNKCRKAEKEAIDAGCRVKQIML